jgi:hypothetical protein
MRSSHGFDFLVLLVEQLLEMRVVFDLRQKIFLFLSKLSILIQGVFLQYYHRTYDIHIEILYLKINDIYSYLEEFLIYPQEMKIRTRKKMLSKCLLFAEKNSLRVFPVGHFMLIQ